MMLYMIWCLIANYLFTGKRSHGLDLRLLLNSGALLSYPFRARLKLLTEPNQNTKNTSEIPPQTFQLPLH